MDFKSQVGIQYGKSSFWIKIGYDVCATPVPMEIHDHSYWLGDTSLENGP